MKSVSEVLDSDDAKDPSVADALIPLVYEELKRLARQRLVHEDPGISLNATALVHEAFVKLVDGKHQQRWDSRGHFFSAAAESMRRILIDRARKKAAVKHGGGKQRLTLSKVNLAMDQPADEILALDEALNELSKRDPRKAELVKLRFFAGLTNEQAAKVLGISEATAYNDWAFARCWLRVETQAAS
ncbi:MAG: sigma-70 family RNA polymerase sigma factor [Planctomycetota bacterium]